MSYVLPLIFTAAAGIVLFMYGTPSSADAVESVSDVRVVDHSSGRAVALGGDAPTKEKLAPTKTQLHATEALIDKTHAAVHNPAKAQSHLPVPPSIVQKPTQATSSQVVSAVASTRGKQPTTQVTSKLPFNPWTTKDPIRTCMESPDCIVDSENLELIDAETGEPFDINVVNPYL